MILDPTFEHKLLCWCQADLLPIEATFSSAWDYFAGCNQLLGALWLGTHVSVGLIDKLGEHAVWILQNMTSTVLSMEDMRWPLLFG